MPRTPEQEQAFKNEIAQQMVDFARSQDLFTRADFQTIYQLYKDRIFNLEVKPLDPATAIPAGDRNSYREVFRNYLGDPTQTSEFPAGSGTITPEPMGALRAKWEPILQTAEDVYDKVQTIFATTGITPSFEDNGTRLARAFSVVRNHLESQPGFDEDERRALAIAFDRLQAEALLNTPENAEFQEKTESMRSTWQEYQAYKTARDANSIVDPDDYFNQVHARLGAPRPGGGQWNNPDVRAIFEEAYVIDNLLDQGLGGTDISGQVNAIETQLVNLKNQVGARPTGASETEVVYHRLREKFDTYRQLKMGRIDAAFIDARKIELKPTNEDVKFEEYAVNLNLLLKKIKTLRESNVTLYSLETDPQGDQHKAEVRQYLAKIEEHKQFLTDTDIGDPTHRAYLSELHNFAVEHAKLYLGASTSEDPEIFTDDVRYWLMGRYNKAWRTVQRYWAIHKADDTALLTDYDRRQLDEASRDFLEAIDFLGDPANNQRNDLSIARRFAAIDVQRNRIKEILNTLNQANEQQVAQQTHVETGDQGLVMWRKFLKAYAKSEDGSPLPDAIINSTTTEAVKEQGRAFMRWIKDVWWEKVADPPNPFLPGFDMKTYSLARLEDKPTVLELVESVPVTAAIRGIFGVMRILDRGSYSYKNQLKPGDQYQGYNEYKTNYLEHLFKLGEMGTGELSMAQYLQWGVQCIALHDLGRREQYRPLLQQLFSGQYDKYDKKGNVVGVGADIWTDFFTDGSPNQGEKKYGGHPMHDVFYEEFSNMSKETTEETVRAITTFILAMDKKYSTGELSFNDAQFVAVTAINAAEFFGIFDTSDTSRISRRIKARFSFLGEYRTRKRGAKELGSKETYHWFRKFFENILRYQINPKTGVSMETVWMLAGHVQDVDKQRLGLPDSVDTVDFGPYTQEMGNVYRRVSEFVLKIYGVITAKEGLGVEWTTTSPEGLAKATRKLRGIKNDVIDYYFNDIEIAASLNAQEKTLISQDRREEAEQSLFQRTAEQRRNFANNGYLLVRGLKLDKESGQFKDPAGGLTSDPNKAAVEYKFTPALDYFNILRHGHHNEAVDMNSVLMGPNSANGSFENWSRTQTQIQQALGSHDTFGRMRLEMVKWLVIDEMAALKKKFHHEMSHEDRNKVIDGLFMGLCQDYHDIEYLTFKNAFEEVDFAPFGLFSFNDVVQILEKAEWIRPLDVRQRANILARRVLPAIAAAVVPEPEV
jgi:hypothetical protein